MSERIVLSLLGLTLLGLALPAEAQLALAKNGKALLPIIIQPGATVTERYAGEELASHLEKITGAKFELKEISSGEIPKAGIIIGPGELTAKLFPEVVDYLQKPSSPFGGEQLTIRTKGNYLLLAGGRPRGTLYAVYRFLSKQCGVRWWTPWATTIPKKRTLTIPKLSIEEKPAFEYREPFWYPAFDGDWAARNYYNGNSARLTEKHGGKIIYKGFVHTFYALVPPQEYFDKHPEWFSLINGKRQWEYAQLCCTNPELRDFITERVRQWLKESPEANIVSISQNDWVGNCQCENCRALDEREGTPAASVLDMVNDIAQRLEKEFPNVAFDTLAYWYTRKPPKTIKPRPNVIVRLCSIECNFAQPLEHESNKAFADDIRGWSKLTRRLYIWDYTTDFVNYAQPHPNWFSLGPNLRFFHKHGVLGVFEEGAYQSHGAEFAELRAWVLAQLLWDPYQDDKKLIDEFLKGYYGKAAPYIRRYMELMHNAAKDYYLGCFTPANAPFFNFETLSEAEKLWQQAEKAVKDDPEIYWRVRQAHMPVYYAFLNNWARLRVECARAGAEWPLPLSRKAVAQEWLSVVTGKGPQGWSPMTHVNEGGLTPQQFVESLGEDDPELEKLPKRIPKEAPLPSDIPGIDQKKCVDVQDDKMSIAEEGRLGRRRVDPSASDYLAVWMPGWHHEWACQVHWKNLPAKAQKGLWKVYAVIKVEKRAGVDPEKEAIWAGVYHTGKKVGLAEVVIPIKETSDGYRSYLIGTVEASPEQYIWIAPPGGGLAGPARLSPGEGNIEGLWIDRIVLVPAK
jgi:hypothetical protein